MNNQEKLATYGTQDEDNQRQKPNTICVDTTNTNNVFMRTSQLMAWRDRRQP
jgi:hypothetical protein